LDANGLTDTTSCTRTDLVKCIENKDAIAQWREGLMAAERLRCNHPSTVLNYWKRNQRPVRSGPKPGHTVTREKGDPRQAHGRPVSWPQDVIKRAAIAIRKDWSNDTFRIARICLEAAIRDDHDLVALMPGPYV
jgi:hypothetical protein